MPEATVGNEEIRLLVDSYYEIQHCRIQVGNRIAMLKRDYEINEDHAQDLHEMMSGHLLAAEKDIDKRVRRWVRHQPIWNEWLKGEVKGVAELLAGGLISSIQGIGRFDTVSKLWKYCGVGINEDGGIQKRRKGEKLNYSPFLKTLCWKIGESFVKISDRGYYGQMLGNFKRREQAKAAKAGIPILPFADVEKALKARAKEQGIPAKDAYKKLYDPAVILTEGHVHARAKRKAVKLFLSHLWLVWREIEGLPTDSPWINATDSAHHYYPPPGWKEAKEEAA